MRPRPPIALALLVALLAAALPARGAAAQVPPAPRVPPVLSSGGPASLVDPFIGTLGSGFEFPGPQAPYGMVQLSPDTESIFAYTGYQYADQLIRGFSHVHVQGMGVPEGGNVPFMPVIAQSSTDVEDYQSPFSHAAEEAAPGYYKVLLARYAITAELAAGLRVGMHRYTFPPRPGATVLIDAGRHIPGGSETIHRTPGAYPATVRKVDAWTIAGSSNPTRTHPQGYAVHFAARFDRPFEFGVYPSRGAAVQWGATQVAGTGAGAAVRFDATTDRDVVIKVGISFVDQAGAVRNLDAELPGNDFGFDALRQRTFDAWNRELQAIEVEGGLPTERVAFATALYHVLQHPNVFSDADGRYIGYDDQIHRIGAPGDPMPAGSTHYANFSFWDTYRHQVQLLMLVAPDRVRDMMHSLNAIRAQGGRLPRWGLMNRYADFMNGEPAVPVFADAYCRGLVPPEAAGPLFADAVRLTLKDRRDPSYLKYGFVPSDISGSGASSTLEHALADFALALVANHRGETATRAALLRRAGSWANQIDPATGFARPRRSNGTWQPNYRPELPDGFREGTGWQYTWLVPHDVAGLYGVIGGSGRNGMATVEQRLDTFFSTSAALVAPHAVAEAQQKLTAFGIVYYGNQYAPSNEHDLHAPYLYAWTGAPWKTAVLARAYQSLYRATPDGVPGNDDLGSMSAWYVWSALGFSPGIPGAPMYVLGSPVFDTARIRLPDGGTFTVTAPGASLANRFVQDVRLDGAGWTRTWFDHDRLADGGELAFELGPVPDQTWGTGAGSAPPSQSVSPLVKFGCTP